MRILTDEIKRRSLTRLYWKLGQRVLLATQQPIIDIASDIEPESLKIRVRGLLKPEAMSEYISGIWIKAGALFAVDMIKRIERIPKKQETSYDFWEDHYRLYSRERTAAMTGEILDSQAVAVNNVIDQLLEEGMERGIGVPEVQRAMRKNLTDTLTEINKYQAERIARTEMIGASNTGSFEGAKETGMDIEKGWLTSGLGETRDSHLFYESLGDMKMDYEYAPGLQYPGDPAGAPEEIVNCRCTIVYNVD